MRPLMLCQETLEQDGTRRTWCKRCVSPSCTQMQLGTKRECQNLYWHRGAATTLCVLKRERKYRVKGEERGWSVSVEGSWSRRTCLNQYTKQPTRHKSDCRNNHTHLQCVEYVEHDDDRSPFIACRHDLLPNFEQLIDAKALFLLNLI